MTILRHISERNEDLRSKGLVRHYTEVEPAERPGTVRIGGRELTMFCTNDYLGLARSAGIKRAMAQATQDYGCGSGSSRYLGGTLQLHHRVEHALARFHLREQGVLFANGYMANLGSLSALAKAQDVIFSDADCHASVIDGARLSRAAVKVWRHNDAQHLRELLAATPCAGQRIVVFESLYSMGGDFAPMADILGVAREFGCLTYVDEIHAVGVYGAGGRGALDMDGIAPDRVDLVMGGTGKAFGTLGGYIATSQPVATCIKSEARAFIFTTAMPAVILAATLRAIEEVHDADDLRGRIRASSARLASLLSAHEFEFLGSRSHIFPIMTGDAQTTADVCACLMAQGYYAQGVKYPSVPADAGRLRVTVTAQHTDEDLHGLVRSLLHARDRIPAFRRAQEQQPA